MDIGRRHWSVQTEREAPTGKDTPAAAAAKPQEDNRISVNVFFPGRGMMEEEVFPGDPVGVFIDNLRCRRMFPSVRDIRVNDNNSVMQCAGWRLRTMTESGFAPNASVKIEPVRPKQVRLAIYSGDRDKPSTERNFSIPGNDGFKWDFIHDVLKEASTACPPKNSLVYQSRSFYQQSGHRRQTVRSYAWPSMPFLDEDSTEPIAEEQWTHYLTEFLSGTTGIRAAQKSVPLIEVFPQAEVLTIGSDGLFHAIERTSLVESDAILMFRGHRLRDGRNRTLALMLMLSPDGYANVDTGKFFSTAENSTKSTKKVNGTWSNAFILLHHNEHLPRYRLPAAKMVRTYTRADVEVDVVEGRVVRRRSVASEPRSVWIRNRRVTDLDSTVTKQLQF